MRDHHSGEEITELDTPVTTDVGQDLIVIVDGAALHTQQISFHAVGDGGVQAG